MSPAQPAHATTTVFVARRILTMNPAQPRATHVAVRDGRILAVGNAEDVQTWGGCAIDETFRDKVLMPGLVEGHCHLMEGAMWDAVYVGYYDRRGPDGKLWRGLTSQRPSHLSFPVRLNGGRARLLFDSPGEPLEARSPPPEAFTLEDLQVDAGVR